MSKLRRRRPSDSPPPGDPDERALHELEASGTELGADHAVQHFLTAESRTGAATATLQLREAGFEASMFENPTDSGWIIVAERTEPLDHESLQLSRSLLELIASRSPGAAYDGWRVDH